MSLKLFVDDVREAPEGWQIVRSVVKCIRILHTQNVEAISLDHDNSHTADGKRSRDFNENHVTCPESYQAVAYYLCAMAETRIVPKVTIHSANPGGAKKIWNILQDSGIDSDIIPIPHPWGEFHGPFVTTSEAS